MDSKASASLFTAAMVPSRTAVPTSAIKAPLSPSNSYSSSSSLPIRAPPSTDDSFDEENGVEKWSKTSSGSSDSDGYHSVLEDPDEDTLEIPVAAFESELDFSLPRMPIAQVSVDDDDDAGQIVDEELVRDVYGEGFSGVVRVPPPLLVGGLDEDQGGNPSLVGETAFRVLGGEEKEPSLENDSSFAVSEPVETGVREEDRVGNAASVENPGDRVLDGEDESGGRNSAEDSFAVEDSVENVSEVSKGEIFRENPILDDNVSPSTEEKSKFQSIESDDGVQGENSWLDRNSAVGDGLVTNAESETDVFGAVLDNGAPERQEGDSAVENGLEVNKEGIIPEDPMVKEDVSPATEEKSEFWSIESEDGVAGEKSRVDKDSSVGDDLVVNTESETSVVDVLFENGAPEMQLTDSAVEETALVGSGSDELSLVSEVKNDELGNGGLNRNECVSILAADYAPSESHGSPGFLESKPCSTCLEVESNELVDSKLQVVETEAEKIAVSDNESDQVSPVYEEAADSEFGGAVSSVTEKINSFSSEEISVPVTDSITKVSGHDSPCKLGFELLVENPNELLPTLAAGRENSMSNNCKAFPAERIEFEPREVINGRYDSQTVISIDELVESNLSKEAESQTIASESAKHVEMDMEISGSPVISGGGLSNSCISEPEISIEDLSLNSVSDPDVKRSYDDSQLIKDEAQSDDSEDESLTDEEDAQGPIMGASKTAEHILREVEHVSFSSQSDYESSREYSQRIDGQIMTDSGEEVDTDEEADGKDLYDSAALAALLKAASSAGPDGRITITAPDAARLFSVERPAGLGSSFPSLKPAAARPNQPNIFTPLELAVVGESDDNMDDEEKKMREKIQGIRVKFLRLVQRLGQSPEDTVAAQVLYRLGLAEGIRQGRQTNRAFSFESARKTAMQMEAAGTDDLDFSCNILILGKSGVGKSATLNSIFGEEKTPISAFESSTTTVKEIIGTVDGIQIRIIDTPGLQSSVMDQNSNRRILLSIKKFMNKCHPDIVLYIDRLDNQTRDFSDLPLLRSISTTLGPSIWLNAIVALTHAASAPPDGPNGSPLSYDMFVAQRSHIVQHSIRQAAADMRLMNPVALVENHSSCRRNREGQRVLPNGQSWRPQLLLLCYSSKILSEANSLLKLPDQSAGKLFGFHVRSPPLPYLLSSLLQSKAHPKLSAEMGGDSVDSDIDLDDLSDSDHEEEDEYDQLPPFKPLRKSQIANLSKEQRKAYFDEYDYRVKLLQKKQWREELHRLRESKKTGKEGPNDIAYGDMGNEDYDQENGSAAAVPVPLPDMALPPAFDGDNPAYRYRFLEPTSQLLVRPVLDTHGWDHDCGYDGVSLEESLAIAKQFPAIVAVQVTKDKREFNIHLDSSISAKHGENGSTLAGFDIQSVGKQLAYILRGETKFQNFKKNKTAAGISVTFLGENVATGLKVEDQISFGKRVGLVASTGAVRSQGDLAYGANVEARLRDKEYPIGQDQATLGLSLMKWRGDLALGANLQSQFSVGQNTKMAFRVGLNNKQSGQITIRTSSSDQLQIALVGIIPIAIAIFRTIWPGSPL